VHPPELACVTLDGQVITQGVPPITVTVKLQELVFPFGSVPLQRTTVVPIGKREPEAGLQATV
jgi:hypothetical protein